MVQVKRMTEPIRFWQWPNLLAFDACLIAVSWLGVFAEEQSVKLPFAAYAVLAMSVWLTYTADRILDTLPRSAHSLHSTRHRYVKAKAKPLGLAWTLVLLINLTTAFLGLEPGQLLKGCGLLVICLTYTALNQVLSHRFFPKELLVALIFAGGTQVFLPGQSAWPELGAFAWLCFINCLMISWKEHSIDAQLQVRSIASALNRRWIVVPFAITTAMAPLDHSGIAVVSSLLALALLEFKQADFHEESFRVCCDAALLLGPGLYFLFPVVLVR